MGDRREIKGINEGYKGENTGKRKGETERESQEKGRKGGEKGKKQGRNRNAMGENKERIGGAKGKGRAPQKERTCEETGEGSYDYSRVKIGRQKQKHSFPTNCPFKLSQFSNSKNKSWTLLSLTLPSKIVKISKVKIFLLSPFHPKT